MRARSRTKQNATSTAPAFPSLWSETKQVYIELQHSKCAFCEKPLEGRIEQDVEHFRPKGEVSDDDPETMLEFEGWTARPKSATGFGRLRAFSMIELFRLNDWAERKELLAGSSAADPVVVSQFGGDR